MNISVFALHYSDFISLKDVVFGKITLKLSGYIREI